MTEIKYMNFTLYKSDLIHYIDAAEKDKNHYRDPDRLDYYIDRVVDSFIGALSDNQFEYDTTDEQVCDVIERLIKEYGCDENGVYSEDAKRALRNVYQYSGLNPENAILTNRQPKPDWRDSYNNFKKTFSSLKTNFKLLSKNLWRSTKNFWNKTKKYVLGGVIIGASLLAVKPAMNFFQSLKKQQPVETKTKVKTNSEQQSSSSDTITWQEVAKNVQPIQNKVNQVSSDTVKKILDNKAKYQTNVISQKKHNQVAIAGLSSKSSENLEKACNRAPTIVINDLIKKGILPADYRTQAMKKYFEKHPKSHVTEVPSRILLQDIHQIYAHSQKDKLQDLSDYVNNNQKRFLQAMKASQFKNLQQLRNARGC